ncbi:MAG: 2,3,4,5-tetrahydropyridine-2,6-dicarboxylate N-succinyltransferase [Candidatus Cloacimonetes bacterium]|nr:2,3,4,5-tetrahydropyridine-2,6-dicarboxylate N-succinyltransferase [Candidatus Cloacimonadota bacterium]
MKIQEQIEKLYYQTEYSDADREIFTRFIQQLNEGKIRSAEKIAETWQTNSWVKQGIIVGFKMGKIVEMASNSALPYLDKDTYPARKFSLEDKIRLVPGGSSVRNGAYIAPSVVMMPPMYVNVGAFVDEGSMIDSHALVGSCAQIGKRVHLSAAAQIGGVIEPIGANPVIIEDDVFIGGNCGVYEGVIIKRKAILAAGTIITAGVPVYDAVNNCYIRKTAETPLTIPENAVVVPGSRPLKSNPEISIYCPVIIKYRDSKTEASVVLEDALR